MRTCRVAADRRLVELAGQIPGWTASFEEAKTSDEPMWFVTPPLTKPIMLGRVVVLGVEPDETDGLLDPVAIAGTTDPSEDGWQIVGMAMTFGALATPPTDDDDGPLAWRARQAVEDAIGDLRDMLAVNHRLSLGGENLAGVHDVRLSSWRGPWFVQGDGSDPGALARFTIDLRAQLGRT